MRNAHQFNLDAAQREIDRRTAEGEDMTGATIDPVTYAIVKPAAITLPLKPTADDIAHLDTEHNARYAPHLLDPANPIRQRIIIERAIIRRAISDILAAGNWVRVFYGAGDGYGCARTDNLDVAMEGIGACDDEYLYVYPNSSDKMNGRVYLVYGNDGWDVIADHSTGRIEPLLAGATELSDAICDGIHA